jgi:predicted aconitase with swiveling domain
MKASPLLPGSAEGELLRLSAPLSFWGGVDPSTGAIIQVRHPQHGRNVAGMILALPETIGSSSSAAVLLELVRNGHAPAALLIDTADAILLIGCLVAREMDWTPPPAFTLKRQQQAKLSDGRYAITPDGAIRPL